MKGLVDSGRPSPETLAHGKILNESLNKGKLEIDKLEQAKKQIKSDLDKNIFSILPQILEELKHEARECQIM
ncbi:hypothetical protein GHT06_008544 [Daphnia sinensis]|nr:hypothetical protein GHT06_008544 [Daphnia sinensis]